MSREPGAFRIVERLQKLGEDIDAGSLRYHRKRVLVSKEFTFDAAHHLHCYEGKCKTCMATRIKWFWHQRNSKRGRHYRGFWRHQGLLENEYRTLFGSPLPERDLAADEHDGREHGGLVV